MDSQPNGSKTGPVTGAVERTVSVLELLALADGPLKLSEIAQQLDIPKSASHRVLTSLASAGWVQQDVQSDCYSLTLRMALIGQRQLDRLRVTDLKQPILEDLARETRELVRLTEVRTDRLVWIGTARGRRSGLVFEPDMSGSVVPFATANGKIWLASLPREKALRIAIESGLGEPDIGTSETVRTVEALGRELDVTRSRDYGMVLGEANEGVGALAVAIRQKGQVVGTMSIAAPLTRFMPEHIEQFLPLLRRAAADMEIIWTSDGR